MKVKFNPNVRLKSFDSTSPDNLLLCEIPTKDSGLATRYAIPATLVAFLERFDGSRHLDQIIDEYAAEYPEGHSVEKLRKFVTQYCLPKRLLIDSTQAYIPPTAEHSRRSYLYLKVGLLPPKMVGKITSGLKWLFEWPVVMSLIPLFIITQLCFFVLVFPHYHFSLNDISGFNFIALTVITSIFGLFHELGHASALTHYGGTRTEIGWGLYFIYTVFYTDLSQAWRLTRKQRAMIDIGGMYFHSLSLIPLLILICVTHIPLLVYCFFFIDMQLASSLNPFLRMDGYWLVSDLFGISDLRKQSMGMLERGFRRITGIKSRAIYRGVPLSRGSSVFVSLYSIFGLLFFISLTGIMFQQVIFGILPAYPKLLVVFWHTLTISPGDVSNVLNLLSGVLWKGLSLLGVAIFLFRFLKGLWKFVQRMPGRGKLGIRERISTRAS